MPLHSVQQRLRELDLLAVCRVSCHHLSSTVCLRCYRGCRAGRSRRSVPMLKHVGNGAYIVTVPRPSTRLCPTSRRHCCQPATLIDVRTTPSPILSLFDVRVLVPRPRPPSELLTMLTNHGGVAVVSVSGVRQSSIALGVDPTSF